MKPFEFERRIRLNKMRTLVCKKNKRGRCYKRKTKQVLLMKNLGKIIKAVESVGLCTLIGVEATLAIATYQKEERRLKND